MAQEVSPLPVPLELPPSPGTHMGGCMSTSASSCAVLTAQGSGGQTFSAGTRGLWVPGGVSPVTLTPACV